jgi:3-deoxy-7-phosphoheptulonate synthase / chorismate mutase
MSLKRAIRKQLKMDPEKQIARLRKQVDACDRKILALLSKRAELVVRIGEFKRQLGLPIRDLKRENEELEAILENNKGPYSGDHVARFFRAIFKASAEILKNHQS